MSFPRYPAYKDSGIKWMGAIPSTWELLRVKHVLARMGSGGTPDTSIAEFWTDDGTPWVAIGDMSNVDHVYETAKSLSQLGISSKQLTVWPKGTLLFSMYASLGHVAELAIDAATNQAILALLPNERVNQSFLKHWFEYLRPTLTEQASSNTQENLNAEKVRNLPVTCPPISEQIAITDFLDCETAKIDALVAEQEQLITLLKEKRQAVISHAVTKGLDPSVPMKDSGVEWLGEVPEHWGVSALSYLSSIETGSTPDRAEPRYWNGTIPWLKTGEINWVPIRDAEEFITDEGLADSAVKLSQPGTLLMAMYGQGVTRGRVALLEIEATYNQACAAITFGDRVMPQFGRYFFMAAYDHIREGGNETSQMNLSAGLIAKFRLTVPPKVEQAAIVQMLDVELSRLDVLCGEAEKAVRILQERRSALISAAVTGQIDVRGLASAPEQAA